jgi:hypothetical protein
MEIHCAVMLISYPLFRRQTPTDKATCDRCLAQGWSRPDQGVQGYRCLSSGATFPRRFRQPNRVIAAAKVSAVSNETQRQRGPTRNLCEVSSSDRAVHAMTTAGVLARSLDNAYAYKNAGTIFAMLTWDTQVIY